MRFLLVDRIVESIPGRLIRGVKHITADDFYVSSLNDTKPYFLSALIGETLGQLAAWNVMEQGQFSKRPVAGVVAKVTVMRRAYVGETLLLESHIDCLDEMAVEYHSQATIGQDVIFTIEGALGPLLPMEQFIDEAVVRQQYLEINRPGDWQALNEMAVGQDMLCLPQSSASCEQFDRILSMEPGVSLTAEKRITAAAPYFADHFPKKPVLPMTILLECKANLAYEFFKRQGWGQSYRLREMRKIKMNEFVYPGDVLTTTLSVKSQSDHELILTYRSFVEGKRVCVLDMVFTAKEGT